MSERSWTPGPWVVCKISKNMVLPASDSNTGIADVAMCGPWIKKVPQDEQDANARLIAAAPEMFELLERVIDPNDHNFNDVESRIREIVKRVKGNQ